MSEECYQSDKGSASALRGSLFRGLGQRKPRRSPHCLPPSVPGGETRGLTSTGCHANIHGDPEKTCFESAWVKLQHVCVSGVPSAGRRERREKAGRPPPGETQVTQHAGAEEEVQAGPVLQSQVCHHPLNAARRREARSACRNSSFHWRKGQNLQNTCMEDSSLVSVQLGLKHQADSGSVQLLSAFGVKLVDQNSQ